MSNEQLAIDDGCAIEVRAAEGRVVLVLVMSTGTEILVPMSPDIARRLANRMLNGAARVDPAGHEAWSRALADRLAVEYTKALAERVLLENLPDDEPKH